MPIDKSIHEELAKAVEDEVEVDSVAKEWLAERAAQETERLKAAGVKPLLLPVRNYGIVKYEDHKPVLIVNRIEINTGFDFEQRVKQIMVSDPQTYPHKENYSYVNVLLLTENMNIPLLVPYIYPTTVKVTPPPETKGKKSGTQKNDLQEWLLINAKGARARHSIHEYHSV
ncbi:hypothetical protein HK097_011541 [Rhizophlyctis rosea]|uniref:Uncharacterized protein n=1 Tax=Rhizophlyctis rosea TaxID=64517 RepID=A0AAD5S667_9FUNG|nr:hypothetical protein HK097_011541 [Rhizophlyctis rosea]